VLTNCTEMHYTMFACDTTVYHTGSVWDNDCVSEGYFD